MFRSLASKTIDWNGTHLYSQTWNCAKLIVFFCVLWTVADGAAALNTQRTSQDLAARAASAQLSTQPPAHEDRLLLRPVHDEPVELDAEERRHLYGAEADREDGKVIAN